MGKIKIIHIHTDDKFIDEVSKFESDDFENITIIIGARGKYQGLYKNSAKYFNYSRKGFLDIIALCKTADSVVLYEMNFPKAYIANRLPRSVIVIWRFFGKELYIKIPEQVFSERTRKALKEGKDSNLYLESKQRLRNFLSVFKYRAFRRNEINKASFKRADFFLGLSKPEYEFLKNIWQDLPPFLQISMPSYLNVNNGLRAKSNLIILGNNRSAYNNHLDIIHGINQFKNKLNFSFLLMFNYGSNNPYTKTVRNEANLIKEIKVVEEFMSLAEFKELYSKADAFVMNGYRQMAMGNLFQALNQNIKIYLNERNIVYAWLKKNGFVVFTMEDFFTDLESNDLTLSKTEAIINQEMLVKFTSKFNKQSFHCTIREAIQLTRT